MVSKEAKKEILNKRNVVGVGRGKKRKDGQKTGEDCVTVLVEKKVDLESLSSDHVIPKEIEGEQSDVVEVGEISIEPVNIPHTPEASDVDPRGKHRPAPCGVSVGHPDVTAGTLGFLAYRKGSVSLEGYSEELTTPIPVICTNNHVGANENDAEIGDSLLQPGMYDGGKRLDEYRIGGLQSFVEINEEDNLVDKAVVDVEDRNANAFIPKHGVPRDTTTVEPGDVISKYGRTTDYREGEVLTVGTTVRVRFNMGVAEFDDQIITESVSSPGDSGSAGLKDGDLFGVLFAGSPTVTVFNKIDNFLNEGEKLYLNPEEVHEDG